MLALIPVIVWIVLIVVLIGATQSGEKVKLKSKYSSLSNRAGFLIAVSIIAIFVFSMFGLYTATTRGGVIDDGGGTVADGFTISSYKVTLDVTEDYLVHVTEDIMIDFYESGHHGIYKFVPYWLQYTDKDGNTKSRKAELTDLRADGEEFSLDTVKKKKRIKIGSANVTLPRGPHQYVIHYDYDFGGDIYEDFDEFIFHAFGDYWGTRIENAEVVINLPKNVDLKEEDIHFFADKKRKEDITENVDYMVYGNTIEAKVKGDYELYRSLTVDVLLPDGYFTDMEDDSEIYGYFSMSICIICIAVALAGGVLWFVYGKDLDPEVETVEFYPPSNLDAAEIGYLYKRDTGKKITIATIINLASKGYIKINEDKDENKLYIHKNVDIEFNDAIERKVTIAKLKKYDKKTPGITVTADKIMSKLGKVGSEYDITKDIDTTLPEIQCLIDNGFIEIKHDSLDDYTSEAIKNIKKDIEEKNKNTLELTTTEKLVFNALFEDGNNIELSENKNFYKVFQDVANTVRNKYDDKINDLKAHKVTIICAIWLFVTIILWGIAYCVIKDMNPKFNILYLVAYIANIVTLIFTILMKRRTQYGEELYAKISGFKNYIEVARKEQLEMLVEENPNYFFDILPYAYVLGISSKWIEKFENIPIPEADWGGINYLDTSTFDSIGSHVYYPSSSGGSSGGGCGGGCSSCGGGCSSCGGGGSW
ncbi:MAG: DUF2207 domain-containing protein [Bacilli bacterium]|nr:DUF2207 domain-containing protein [Bacilli bacterium]